MCEAPPSVIEYTMSKMYLLSSDSLKTICQGALGALTFGVYHQYTSNQIMESNNEKQNLRHKIEMNKLREEIEEFKRTHNVKFIKV